MSSDGQFLTDRRKGGNYRKALARKYELERESGRTYRLELYETFDWRIYRKGLFAYSSGGLLTVGRSLAGPPSLTCVVVAAVPRFWWEFEDEKARTLLKDMIGPRALLPLLAVTVDEERYNVRNRDGKTICRLSFVSRNAVRGPARSYLSILPLRGYATEAGSMASIAEKVGMDKLPVPLLEDIFLAGGRKPGDYSSKLDIRLGRKMTISEAVVLIDQRLLSTIRANIQGVIEDYDTEFLHDLRVATRRTRACLSQLKEALPPEASKHTEDLRSVAQGCNELRDLDVYLLEKESYYKFLPEHLCTGLDQYFRYVARKRVRLNREFSAYLQSDEFGSLLRDWEAFLKDPKSLVNDSPAARVARAKIRDRFQKIIKKGRKIDDSTPNSALHALRIECKKLRYLLEFFQSYYPQKKMNELISYLKKLQDNLGEFNDLTVQQNDLKAYMRTSKSKANAQMRDAATGGLLTVLNNRQTEVRKEFYRRFAGFDSEENRSLYKELFGQRDA